MAYVDYTYYITAFGGDAIPIADFNRAINRATAYLDYLTFGRATIEVDGNIKMAACAIAEDYHAEGIRDGKASENNDGLAITWDTNKTLEERLLQTALIYLANSGLCYRGMNAC